MWYYGCVHDLIHVGHHYFVYVQLCVNLTNLLKLTLSDPTSDLVRHYDFPLPLRCRVTSDTFFCCVCAPALLSEPVRRFSSCTDFSQQIAQVVLFLLLSRYAVGRKIGLERVNSVMTYGQGPGT